MKVMNEISRFLREELARARERVMGGEGGRGVIRLAARRRQPHGRTNEKRCRTRSETREKRHFAAPGERALFFFRCETAHEWITSNDGSSSRRDDLYILREIIVNHPEFIRRHAYTL